MSTIPSRFVAWKLEKIIKMLHWSNTDMAEVLGVSKQALHQFLHPTSKNIQDRTIIGICEKLKISVDKFTEDYDEWEKECVHNIYLIENAPSLMENMLNSRFVRKLLATVAREKFGANDDEYKNIMYMDVKTQKAAGGTILDKPKLIGVKS